METTKKIQVFTELKVWQEGHKLVLMIYKFTKDFPKEETFGLVSQMRRAVARASASVSDA